MPFPLKFPKGGFQTVYNSPFIKFKSLSLSLKGFIEATIFKSSIGIQIYTSSLTLSNEFWQVRLSLIFMEYLYNTHTQ